MFQWHVKSANLSVHKRVLLSIWSCKFARVVVCSYWHVFVTKFGLIIYIYMFEIVQICIICVVITYIAVPKSSTVNLYIESESVSAEIMFSYK